MKSDSSLVNFEELLNRHQKQEQEHFSVTSLTASSVAMPPMPQQAISVDDLEAELVVQVSDWWSVID